ncbi:hypothetical protein PV327_011707 [Microctonus hyperodae]|uniref:Uncharacterized protein n=1 Tax=Microctonus hyperodae TaxID=165561 RepID=A0AA39C318_MICHY|nr:hypothetical protein PV327_011707 [Microctonus hyperodae]
MKSLRCFCNENINCDHFKHGVMIYSLHNTSRLRVEDLYGTDSESGNEKDKSPKSEQIITPKNNKHQTEDEQPSTLKKT